MKFKPPITYIDDKPVNTKLFFVEASYSVIDETYYTIIVEINDRMNVNTEHQKNKETQSPTVYPRPGEAREGIPGSCKNHFTLTETTPRHAFAF